MHTHLDNDDAAAAAAVVPMVDNDNEHAPENHPVAKEHLQWLVT